MFALLIVAAALFPKLLSQLYELPPVAVTLIDVVAHVNSVVPVLFVIPAVGAGVFDVTAILSVSVQLLPSVTVTVYVLALLIVAAALLPKLLSQLYELPPLAVTLIDVVAHVNSVVPVLFVITAVGLLLFVITTSSVAAVHEPLDTVHLSVALLPAETPVTADVLEDEVEILADPLVTLHAPVPKLGLVAAIVKLELAHWDISLPAAELGVL